MRADTHQPVELPPYRAVLVVDVKDFSGRKSRFHKEITEQIPIILENAFIRCGHGHLWNEGFGDTTGDGYFRILDPMRLPHLLNPFLPALQDELDDQNSMLPAAYGNLRMRVVLAVGPVTDSGEAVLGDGNGATRIEAHRMLDSEPVRDILACSGDVTRVAAIVSPRVFEDAVHSGYAADDPSLYVPVEVEVKTFEGIGYLRVPRPSGDLLRDGLVRTSADAADPEDSGRGGGAASRNGSGDRSVRNDVQATNATFVQENRGSVNSGNGTQNNTAPGDGVNVFGSNRGKIEQRVDKGGSDADG